MTASVPRFGSIDLTLLKPAGRAIQREIVLNASCRTTRADEDVFVNGVFCGQSAQIGALTDQLRHDKRTADELAAGILAWLEHPQDLRLSEAITDKIAPEKLITLNSAGWAMAVQDLWPGFLDLRRYLFPLFQQQPELEQREHEKSLVLGAEQNAAHAGVDGHTGADLYKGVGGNDISEPGAILTTRNWYDIPGAFEAAYPRETLAQTNPN